MKFKTLITNTPSQNIAIFCLALALQTNVLHATEKPIQIANTSLPYAAIDSIALPDVTNDGVGDFGVLYAVGTHNSVSLQIIDGLSLNQGSILSWFNDLEEPSLHLVTDSSGNKLHEIGVFGVRAVGRDAGKPHMIFKDFQTLNNTKIYNWPANWTDVKALVLDDMNGDGVIDVALQGIFKEGARPQLVIRDGQTSESLTTYSYPDLLSDPEYFQHSDMNGDGVREIATFGRIKSDNRIQVKISDGTDPSNRFTFYTFPDNWSDIEWLALDDHNNDDVPDWGLFGVNRLDGRPQLIVKSGNDTDEAMRQYSWSEDITTPTFFTVPDMNNDGINEVAVAGLKTDGQYQFEVKDGANSNISLANHDLNLDISDVSFHVLGDLTNDGIVEIGFFGIDEAGNYVLHVQNGNGIDGNVTQFNIGSQWPTKPALHNIADINGDKLADIVFIGNDSDETTLQIWAIPATDTDNDGFPDTIDAFPENDQEWLDSDNDTVGNNEDGDDDNDGIADDDDAFPTISIIGFVDSDGDGSPDDCDSACILLGMTADTDDNGNGIPDEPVAIASTTIPYIAIDSITLPDINNDGFADFGIFHFDSYLNGHLDLLIVDGVNLLQGQTITWGNHYEEPSVHLIPDRSGNNSHGIGVFGLQTGISVNGVPSDKDNAGKPKMLVRDLQTSMLTKEYTWPANWTNVKPLVLEDINGDNIVDVAIQGIFKEEARPQLVIRDGHTEGSLATYSYPDLLSDPEYFQHSDMNGDGVREIATFGRIKANNKIQVKIADGTDPSNRLGYYTFADDWSNVQWLALDDHNNDDVPDWGLFGVNRLDGRPQLIVKSGNNTDEAMRQFSWSEDMTTPTFFTVPDMNNDGINEVAVAGLKTNGQYQFEVKDGANSNVSLATHILDLDLSDVSFHVLGDLTFDGIVEIGFFGKNDTDNYVLQVQNGNGIDGSVTQFNIGTQWSTKPALQDIGDINGNGKAEILFQGAYSDETLLQIWAFLEVDSDG